MLHELHVSMAAMHECGEPSDIRTVTLAIMMRRRFVLSEAMKICGSLPDVVVESVAAPAIPRSFRRACLLR